MLRPPITTFEGMLDRGIHVITGFPGHPPTKGTGAGDDRYGVWLLGYYSGN